MPAALTNERKGTHGTKLVQGCAEGISHLL